MSQKLQRCKFQPASFMHFEYSSDNQRIVTTTEFIEGLVHHTFSLKLKHSVKLPTEHAYEGPNCINDKKNEDLKKLNIYVHRSVTNLLCQLYVRLLLSVVKLTPPVTQYLGDGTVLQIRVALPDNSAVPLAEDEEGVHWPARMMCWLGGNQHTFRLAFLLGTTYTLTRLRLGRCCSLLLTLQDTNLTYSKLPPERSFGIPK
ncbi:hypothetical protein PR048_030573 [Dryococelus australis]|uniref:Uncharacterized protein n=1 Tax=Dryococelus australis TaxID=614101 RepID=A0ABQ9GA51_9NEOP|nr:hypothetical protein PR048_030573 [Dryococelus australis]